jgi:YesN/AraC family two-component response regulator
VFDNLLIRYLDKGDYIMFKRIKGLFNDIHEISLTLKDICLKPNYGYELCTKLENIANKLEANNKTSNSPKKISHSVWLMSQDETKCVLANDISVWKTIIKVNGLDFETYESNEKAKEEFVEICNWIADSNVSGTGIYQLTK